MPTYPDDPIGAGLGGHHQRQYRGTGPAPRPILAIWLAAGLALLVLGGLAWSRSHVEADPKPLEMSATPFQMNRRSGAQHHPVGAPSSPDRERRR
jgi:hypothetical protein